MEDLFSGRPQQTSWPTLIWPLIRGWSIVRDAEPLTAREHLNAAWEAAHVPEDGVIPAGVAHISRWGDGNDYAYLEGRIWERAAVEANVERRLLDPPPAVMSVVAPAIQAAKAEAWDEGCEAFAWCRDNGPIEDALPYVAHHNPYKEDPR